MARRRGTRGRRGIAGRILAVGLLWLTGSSFGGCGGSAPGPSLSAGGPFPEHVVQKLRDCGERGPSPAEPERHTVAFDVFMAPDGLVEQVTLRSSTLHADEVEACMERALGALSGGARLSLRRREPDAPAPVPREGRALLGHPVAIAVGAAEIAVVIGFLYVTIVVYYQVVRGTETYPPPPPVPFIQEPPEPGEAPAPEPKATTGPTPPIPPDPPKPPKPKPRCEVVYPKIVNCSYIQQAKYPSRKAALEATIKKLPRERQKRPFTTRGNRDADEHSGVDHTTYYSADRRTKITIGCYPQCCKNTADGPVLEEGLKCYEHNTEYLR